ncbi:MAG: phosphatase PAP2 family protein [Ferruginibacter sp.]
MQRLVTFLFIFLLSVSKQVNSQTAQDSSVVVKYNSPGTVFDGKPYHIKPKLDIPIAVGATAWTLYGFSVVYNRDTVTAAELGTLNRNNVDNLDRGTTRNYSENARKASDKFFYGSMGLPFFLLLDKRIRKDAGNVGLLYLETMATTGTIYTIAAMSANRFRPYAYNTDVPIAKRSRGGSRNSFFAGHPSIVGTSTFFIAGVYSHYHPEMKNKWILYTAAAAATLTTGYLRYKAGQHFPTDIIVGTLIGPTVGLLVPHFHNYKNKDRRLSFSPHFNQYGSGVTAFYKLK